MKNGCYSRRHGKTPTRPAWVKKNEKARQDTKRLGFRHLAPHARRGRS